MLRVNYLALRELSERLLDRMDDGAAIVNTASIAGNLWRKRAEPINALLDLGVADGWAPALEWFEANRESLRHLAASRRAGEPWFSELSHAQMLELLDRHGFELVTARAFAVLPAGAYRRAWLRAGARLIDDFAARVPLFWRWGTDVVYVARRK